MRFNYLMIQDPTPPTERVLYWQPTVRSERESTRERGRKREREKGRGGGRESEK